MRAERWKSNRKAAGLTQVEAAARLGISQAYLSLIEAGRRVAPPRLLRKMAKLYGLSPVALPMDSGRGIAGDSASVAAALASLGYPGFAYLGGGDPVNPATVLLAAIHAADLETRVLEALPWLIAEYNDLDWDWLVREAKLHDVQNRLGFLVALGRRVAEGRGDRNAVRTLRSVEQILERARLAREDTLCQESMPEAERRWLRQTRSPEAAHWNLLTGLDLGSLPYAA